MLSQPDDLLDQPVQPEPIQAVPAGIACNKVQGFQEEKLALPCGMRSENGSQGFLLKIKISTLLEWDAACCSYSSRVVYQKKEILNWIQLGFQSDLKSFFINSNKGKTLSLLLL